MTSDLELRPATHADLDFLHALRRETLGAYVVQTYGAWDEAVQRARFDANTDPAHYRIVEDAGRPIGCLGVEQTPVAHELHRVFLLPAVQRQGLGTRLVRLVLCEAAAAQVPLRLRVLRVNPARRLYERLGLVVTGETETHFEMERSVHDDLIRIVQKIAAPPDRVFRAWFDPADLAVWAWASLSRDVRAAVEPRVGGRYDISTARADGARWSFAGRFTAVVPGVRVSQTLVWHAPVGYEPGEEYVAAEFRPNAAGGTSLSFAHSGVFGEQARTGHDQGWRQALEMLAAHVEAT